MEKHQKEAIVYILDDTTNDLLKIRKDDSENIKLKQMRLFLNRCLAFFLKYNKGMFPKNAVFRIGVLEEPEGSHYLTDFKAPHE